MKAINKKILVLMLTFAVICVNGFAAVSDPAAAAALEKMPPADAKLEQLLNAEIVKAGPKAIGQVCGLIVPPGTGDDTAARYLLSSLSFYTSRPDADAERKMYAKVLGEALAKASNTEVKRFFIGQLELVGDVSSVPVLSKTINDYDLCARTLRTLEVIGGDSVKKVIHQAMGKASPKNLPEIIYSLGRLQYEEARKDISKYVTSKDKSTRLISIGALAEIGERKSAGTLEKALEKADSAEKSQIAAYYIRLGERLSDGGFWARWKAKGIGKKILASEDTNINSAAKSSALKLMVRMYGVKAMNYLTEAFDGGVSHLKYAAVTLAGGIDDSEVTKVWGEKLLESSTYEQIMIMEMFASRGDKDSSGYIRKAYDKGEPAVKIAALKSIVKIDKDGAVDDVVAAIDSNDEAFVEAVKSLLMQVPTEKAGQVAVKSLPTVSAKGQVAIIEFLAARRVKSSLDTVFNFATDEDKSVSIAAMKAIGFLAGSSDAGHVIYLAMHNDDTNFRAEAFRVAVKLCRQSDDVQAAAEPVFAAMKDASPEQTAMLIGILAELGTEKAYEVVVEKTKSSNELVKDAAVRGLVKWQDVKAKDELIRIAKETDQLAHHVLALKAYVDLAAKSQMADSLKAEAYAEAISAARRDQEKSFVISRLNQIRTVEALELAVSLLDDKSLNAAASNAIVSIALPREKGGKGLGGVETAKALIEANTKIENSEIRKKVEEYLKTLPEPKKPAAVQKSDDSQENTSDFGDLDVPEGFYPLFNGKDLAGWKGLLAKPYDNPIKRAGLSEKDLAERQAEANERMRKHWEVVDGVLYFDGKGFNLATDRDFGDFELLVDWKLLQENGDSGVYLRGSPQVQIWDPAHWKIGSGGLYNNKKNPSKPLMIADNPIGEWNNFRIKMVGEKVTVHLNGKLVVDNVTLENFWDRSRPIFATGQIELQCHGNPVCFKNIFIREIGK